MTTAFANGSELETSMFGYESAIGSSALMGVKRSLNRTSMQLAGHGYASPLEAARANLDGAAHSMTWPCSASRFSSLFQRKVQPATSCIPMGNARLVGSSPAVTGHSRSTLH